MDEIEKVARKLTIPQRQRITDARYHEFSKSWRVIVSGKMEKTLQGLGLVNDRAFAALTVKGCQVREWLMLSAA